eukprot:TRINITY_DN4252_c0_g1_i1.p2 TRINITY_DN4252_c0_g1~~TRINITY_DN4252_c0_g1_i1.p2  ORF type:complete len:332 (+),score=68.61 TRINITY_DN4252_c0_g1_i1:128-1123(+)
MGNSGSNIVGFEDLVPSKFPREEGMRVGLRDGRFIGYGEYGNRTLNDSTVTIFFIPGMPGSRFFVLDEAKLQESNIRMVVVERPGYGLSSPNPSGTLLSFADDLEQLADILRVDSYGVIGYSAGGPYALACAHASPDRIFGAAIVSSVAPRDPKVDFSSSMTFTSKIGWWCTANAKWILSSVFKSEAEGTLKDPRSQGRTAWSNHSSVDRKMYKQNEHIEKLFLSSSLEIATRKQHGSYSFDWKLFSSDWKFDLADIKCGNVTVYHGKEDRGCSLKMGEYIAEKIPNCQKKFYEGKGHLVIFDVWEEILEGLCKDARNGEASTKKELSNQM